MSDTPSTDRLVQRLAVDRLAAPGVLDRHALQRTSDKFSNATSAHVLPRLHRRAEPTAHNTESLPLVRIDRSVDPGAASSMSSVASEGAAVAAASNDRDVAHLQPQQGATSSFVGELVARRTPGITRTSELVARRTPGITRSSELVARRAPSPSGLIASPSGLVGGAQPNTRLLERANISSVTPTGGGRPSIAASAAATGVVQRVALSTDSGRANPVGEPSKSATASTGVSATAAASSIGEAGLPAMTMRRSSPADEPARTRVSSRPPIAAALPVTSASPVVAAAPAQLVLRKPDVAAMPSQHLTHAASTAGHAPTITSSPTGVIARTPAAPNPTPTAPAWTHGHDIHLDWIAEQVGHRLARRLEVERERMGVRQWRQLS